MKENRALYFLTGATLLIFLSSAAVLRSFSHSHRLGEPGVVVDPEQHPKRLNIPLPENVLNYHAVPYEPADVELSVLPDDTLFGKCRYENGDEEIIDLGVVLMGTDRTSIHKPQFCLNGQGWVFEKTEEVRIPISEPVPYEIPALKITMSKEMQNSQGEKATLSGIFIYWFVSGEHLTARHGTRMWLMAKGLLTEGELQRWAYIHCLGVCFQGFEDRTFERMKKLLAETVPQFQLVHGREAVVD